MLGNKKNQNKTVFGGIGIALLLCALMALMPLPPVTQTIVSSELSKPNFPIGPLTVTGALLRFFCLKAHFVRFIGHTSDWGN